MSDQRPRSRLPWILAVGAALIVAWVVLAGFQVAALAADADRGIDEIEAARIGIGDMSSLVGTDAEEQQVADAALTRLDAAVEDFDAARSRATGPLLAPARVLPVIGRQLRAVSAMATAASDSGTALSSSIEELRQLAATPAATPEQRVSVVSATSAVLGDLVEELDDQDLGPTEGLLPPVADARNRLSAELAGTRSTLGSAVVGLDGVGAMLEGPSTYLVLAANNAEMRAGSGMFLQVGTLTSVDGRFELSEFVTAESLLLEDPGATLDPDIAARWGALLPNQEWRNLNLSPRFDETARMATEMWAAAGRGEVDGVMALDVVAVRDLLALTGPVDVVTEEGATTLDEATVMTVLLHTQYDLYDDQGQRRDQLGRVTSAIFTAFNERDIPASELVALLGRAGARRNVLMWSDDPVQQAAWQELGLTGELPPDALMASLVSRGGGKLDPYLQVTAQLSAVPVAGPDEDGAARSEAPTRVRVVVRIVNTAPDGLPDYVQGPVPGSGGVAGEYVGILALTVPGSASEPSTSGDGFAVLGDDGATRVIGTNVAIPRGEEREVTVEFDLPADMDAVQVLSSARTPPTKWTAGSSEWVEDGPRTVTLDPVG